MFIHNIDKIKEIVNEDGDGAVFTHNIADNGSMEILLALLVPDKLNVPHEALAHPGGHNHLYILARFQVYVSQ